MNFRLIMGEMFALERNKVVDLSHPSANKGKKLWKHVCELKLDWEFIKAVI